MKKLTKSQKAAQKAAAAQKAVKTRKFRQTLLKTYGWDTYEVLELMSKGKSNVEVELLTHIPMSSIAAYRANKTRGLYDWVLRNCNF